MGTSFSLAEGVGMESFEVVLTQELEVLAILSHSSKGGGGGAKSFTLSSGGGGGG